MWADPVTYLGTESGFGNRKTQVQEKLIEKYRSAGKKVLISAFGNVEQPTTSGANSIAVAKKLAKFVIDNGFDGVDIAYNDDYAMSVGTAEIWLSSFTK